MLQLLALASVVLQLVVAECPLGSPVRGSNSIYWEGEVSIVSTTTFKINDYKVINEYDLFWYGLPLDGSSSEKIYEKEQTKDGVNDDSNTAANGVARDAVFTIVSGKSLANYKEIQLWCDSFPGSYGVVKYDPSNLSLTSDSCLVGSPNEQINNSTQSNSTGVTTEPTNDDSSALTIGPGITSAVITLFLFASLL